MFFGRFEFRKNSQYLSFLDIEWQEDILATIGTEKPDKI